MTPQRGDMPNRQTDVLWRVGRGTNDTVIWQLLFYTIRKNWTYDCQYTNYFVKQHVISDLFEWYIENMAVQTLLQLGNIAVT